MEESRWLVSSRVALSHSRTMMREWQIVRCLRYCGIGLISGLTAGFYLFAASINAEASNACRYSSYSVQIIDDAGIPESKNYVAATLPSLLKTLFGGSPPPESNVQDADVQIIYVLSYNTYKSPGVPDRKSVLDLLETLPKSQYRRTLMSPWVRMGEQENCKLTITLLWNTRQFIADQAVIAGVEGVSRGIVTFENDPDFFVPKEYERLVIQLDELDVMFPGEVIAKRPSLELNRQQRLVMSAVQNRFPPELFWWLSQIDSTRYDTDTGTFINQMVSRERKLFAHVNTRQSRLVISLVAQFLYNSTERNVIEGVVDVDVSEGLQIFM